MKELELETMNFGDVNIEKLFQLFKEHNLAELSIKNKNLKINLKKDLPKKVEYSVTPTNMFSNYSQQPTMQPQNVPTPAITPLQSPVKDEAEKYHKIFSPIVGTFYRAPSPESPPFIKEGDMVSPDTTVGIVEAMKVMNEIKAEVSGKVIKILVQNAEPVMVDHVLFWIET